MAQSPFWEQVYGALVGGWRTYGPNVPGGFVGAFNSDRSGYDAVSAASATKLSAALACLRTRGETIGSLPLHLRDDKKNIISDHDLYSVLHDMPNSRQTNIEFFSLQVAGMDLYGNALSLIDRNRKGNVISLQPIDWEATSIEVQDDGSLIYKNGNDRWPEEKILHLKGFSLSPILGMSMLEAGRNIMAAQIAANDSAQRTFKQGMKVGGFFTVAENLNDDQLEKFRQRLDFFGKAENAGKYMTLLKGMQPVSGQDFRVKPADAELLQSRYFGIEEICRLFNTPPVLIGHTDKASSWASSLENTNLFFLMYSLQPTFIRIEQQIYRKLLTPADRARRYRAKFSVEGLQRTDARTRAILYAAGLQNGYLNRDEVRDMEERGTIPGGDAFTIQTNLTEIDKLLNAELMKQPQANTTGANNSGKDRPSV